MFGFFFFFLAKFNLFSRNQDSKLYSMIVKNVFEEPKRNFIKKKKKTNSKSHTCPSLSSRLWCFVQRSINRRSIEDWGGGLRGLHCVLIQASLWLAASQQINAACCRVSTPRASVRLHSLTALASISMSERFMEKEKKERIAITMKKRIVWVFCCINCGQRGLIVLFFCLYLIDLFVFLLYYTSSF